MSTLRKAFPTQSRASDVEAGIYQVIVSTETPDRNEDVVMASGGKFDSFMANPVVLFAHDYTQLPVARALDISAEPGRVVSTFQFPPLGQSARADEVHALWRGGFLNAVSLGAVPLAAEPRSGGRGVKYTRWELVEYSIVPVPMNRDALRRALALVEQSEDDERLALAMVKALKEVWQ